MITTSYSLQAAERAVEQARDMGYDRVDVHTDSKFLTKCKLLRSAVDARRAAVAQW